MIAGIVAGQAGGEPIVPTEFVVGHAGTLYVANSGVGSLTVDWGDGSPIETTTTYLTHEYPSSAFTGRVYKSSGELVISGTPLTSISSIQSGLSGVVFYTTAFNSANLTSVPNSIPSSISDMYGMFINASSFNSDISLWDVSNVTNMGYMFAGASSFNSDISLWDVSSATNMTRMFFNTTSFNQDLSSWCVSNIASTPTLFDDGATAWTLPRPVWGTCPNG